MLGMSSSGRGELRESLFLEVRTFIAGVILSNQAVADEVGLNLTDLQCLHLLELQGEAMPGEFAKWARLSTGGVTVALDRLEGKGYLKREPNPNDRRSTIVRPIPAGLRKLHAIYRERAQTLQQILSTYSEPELRVLKDFFVRTNGSRGKFKNH